MLTNIANSFQLCIFSSIVQVPTRYVDNWDNFNSVINLMFLRLISEGFNNHSIHADWRLSLDYAPLTVKISIFEENIQTRKHTIVKNSEEDHNFVTNVKDLIKDLNINSKDNLENIVQEFANNTNNIWFKYLKLVNITKYSNLW